MREGSIVETVGDFEEVRATWGFPYPKKGDVLTVSRAIIHPTPSVGKHGILMLWFAEKPDLVTGISSHYKEGRKWKPNFLELTLPKDVEELLTEEYVHLEG